MEIQNSSEFKKMEILNSSEFEKSDKEILLKTDISISCKIKDYSYNTKFISQLTTFRNIRLKLDKESEIYKQYNIIINSLENNVKTTKQNIMHVRLGLNLQKIPYYDKVNFMTLTSKQINFGPEDISGTNTLLYANKNFIYEEQNEEQIYKIEKIKQDEQEKMVEVKDITLFNGYINKFKKGKVEESSNYEFNIDKDNNVIIFSKK